MPSLQAIERLLRELHHAGLQPFSHTHEVRDEWKDVQRVQAAAGVPAGTDVESGIADMILRR